MGIEIYMLDMSMIELTICVSKIVNELVTFH